MQRERFRHNDKDYYLVLIDQQDVGEMWSYVRDGVEKAMVHSDSVMNGDDFLNDLTSGNCRLWAFISDAKVVVPCLLIKSVIFSRRIITKVGKSF